MTDKEWFREYWRRCYEEEFKPTYDAFIALYPFTTENLDGEEWLPVPYCADYHMSTFGRVKSFKNGEMKILKPGLTSRGYLCVSLYKDGKNKTFSIHVLVGKLFIPNPENKPEVNHIYSRFSNHVDCLEWATSKENMEHAVRTGLTKSGEDTYNAKFTDEQVLYIRQNPDGLNLEQFAEMFAVTPTTISRVQRGKAYKSATGTIRKSKAKVIPEEIRAKIRAEYVPYSKEFGMRALAKKYGVSERTILRIVQGHR